MLLQWHTSLNEATPPKSTKHHHQLGASIHRPQTMRGAFLIQTEVFIKLLCIENLAQVFKKNLNWSQWSGPDLNNQTTGS